MKLGSWLDLGRSVTPCHRSGCSLILLSEVTLNLEGWSLGGEGRKGLRRSMIDSGETVGETKVIEYV